MLCGREALSEVMNQAEPDPKGNEICPQPTEGIIRSEVRTLLSVSFQLTMDAILQTHCLHLHWQKLRGSKEWMCKVADGWIFTMIF